MGIPDSLRSLDKEALVPREAALSPRTRAARHQKIVSLLAVAALIQTALFLAWRLSISSIPRLDNAEVVYSRNTTNLTPRQHLLASWLGKHAYHVKSNAVCFKYSNDRERAIYNNPDTPIACFVENLCYNETWTIPTAEDESLNTQTDSVIFAAGHNITRRSPSPVLPFPLLKEDTLVVASRFKCQNVVHQTEEFAASVFQQLVAIGKYNFATLELDRRSTRLRIMQEFAGGPDCPFDEMFDALTASPVDYGMPDQPFCVKNAWVGLTFGVNPPDGRFEFQPPQYSSPESKPDFMLFGRHIVRWVLNRLYSQRYDALLASKLASRTGLDALSTANWLAERERDFFALDAKALSTARASVVDQTGLVPGGWTAGTRLLLLRRTGRRVIENQDDLDIAVRDAFATRGYPVTIATFTSGTLLETQVLAAATSTVFASAHGSGLGNCIYLPPRAGLMEMIHRRGMEQWFSKYAADMQLRYYRYTNIHDWRSLTKHDSFKVEIPAVLDMLTVALFMSDATFGPPALVTRRITVDEAVRAAASVLGGMSRDFTGLSYAFTAAA